MIRRPWHARGGRILDWNDRPIAKVIDEGCAEARLIAMAPELALAYIDVVEECEDLREEVSKLEERLSESETSEHRKSA